MADDEITLETLMTFQLGDMEGGIALVLGYATSPEKLTKGEMDTFAIGMTREKAAELGRALVEITDKAALPRGPRRREH
jgi:hypothetical protein